MNQKDKNLLLKELSARLPYGVKIIQCGVVIETLQSICKVGEDDYTINPLTNDSYNGFYIEQTKPYLRPMSSMTEEEDKEFALLQVNTHNSGFWYAIDAANMINWLNAHHFDYRGLIEKGLALEAPEGMYKTE